MNWTIASPLLTFFLGLILGHRLTLSRDQRQEYNAIAERARDALYKERAECRGVWLDLTPVEWERVEAMLPPWRRPSLRRARALRDEAFSNVEQSPDGQLIYTRPELFEQAANALLQCIKLK